MELDRVGILWKASTLHCRVMPTYDGQVDVLGDAFALVENLGTTSGATFSQGDFNGDGAVDVLNDAFTLVANLGRSVIPQEPVPAASNFATLGRRPTRRTHRRHWNASFWLVALKPSIQRNSRLIKRPRNYSLHQRRQRWRVALNWTPRLK